MIKKEKTEIHALNNKQTMTVKNTDKNKDAISELGKVIAPILVINNASLKPYIESFQYAPENLYQQPLGTLVGFFEIKEYSEDSAYVVNFLTSVLKKEYFINPKRSVEESLDCALHKVNLALSELVKHGNINWLGKLDGVVCVLEKNNIHFGVSGQAKVFLSRNTHFIEISEGLASEEIEPHPLKTFVNVSSGRLEKGDRILVTSEDIFHILTTAQLGKNVQRFEGEKLTQFLKTALTNELEMANVIVIDVITEEKQKAQIKKAPKKNIPAKSINVFSEKTFKEKQEKAHEEPVVVREFPEDDSEEYTDKKTGHIYIQGEIDATPKASPAQIYSTIAKEHIGDFFFAVKSFTKKRSATAKKSIAKSIQAYKERRAAIKEQKEQEKQLREKALKEQQERELQEQEEMRARKEELLAAQREATHHVAIQDVEEEMEHKKLDTEKPLENETAIEMETKEPEIEKNEPSKPLSLQEKIARARIEMSQSIPVRTKSAMDVKHSKKEIETPELADDSIKEEQEAQEEENFPLSKLENFWHANERVETRVVEKKTKEPRKIKLVPDFGKIKNLFEKFSAKQKIAIVGIIAAIVFVPLILEKVNKSQKQPIVETPQAPPSLAEQLALEKNIVFDKEVSSYNSTNNAVGIEVFDGSPYIISNTVIIGSMDNNPKEHQIPQDQGVVVATAFMKDLNLILLLTDQKKVISFSPISQQFKTNAIEIPETADLRFIETFLTYMYMVDEKNNQIYRFPRAEGGFGSRSEWLKDNTSLAGIKDITLDENIYIVSNNKITKLFKNEKQEITFETSATPINYDKIYTNEDLSSIYVLDKKNARLVQYAKDGSLTKQFFSEKLKDATTFAVDEKNMKAYLATPQGVQALSM